MHTQLQSSPRLPLLTAAIALLAVTAMLIPELTFVLQWERSPIRQGEVWRLLTGHLTHWTWNHLLWDLAVFLVLGAALERRGRARLAALLMISSLLISLTLLATGRWELYRGLSGTDSALFGAFCVQQMLDSDTGRRSLRRWFPAALLLLFGGKILWETLSGQTVFVSGTPAFLPVPEAHLLGALSGVAFGMQVPICPLRVPSEPLQDGVQHADSRFSS